MHKLAYTDLVDRPIEREQAQSEPKRMKTARQWAEVAMEKIKAIPLGEEARIKEALESTFKEAMESVLYDQNRPKNRLQDVLKGIGKR